MPWWQRCSAHSSTLLCTALRLAALQSVGCAGEVVLHEAPGEDYEKYAIEIR